ncbi:hypothetical protein FGM00_09755 [Aggregatimonas sangjinii]|uniref:Lipoprotein n=1 Tax=Aggregatimonas sangjinii TaxID=2583587 RepID=A0A5B7STK8_9FLAO|nr:hypothetical protein [Aggregatimonas sangjinii]QCX00383.1 hypothetical protein FGM00_09755 [Aggregatimonas sangjinii]
MKKILFLLLVTATTSCIMLQEKGIAFKITNNSGSAITGVKIATSENLDSITFEHIAKRDSREGFLSMKNNKTDGSYTLAFKDRDGNVKGVSTGYYTNGNSLDSYIRFEIQKDTTLVKFGEFP